MPLTKNLGYGVHETINKSAPCSLSNTNKNGLCTNTLPGTRVIVLHVRTVVPTQSTPTASRLVCWCVGVTNENHDL